MPSFKHESFRLHIGDRVRGRKGRHELEGTVMESTKKSGKPAVFSRWGFVGCWVKLDNGKKTVLNELELIEGYNG